MLTINPLSAHPYGLGEPSITQSHKLHYEVGLDNQEAFLILNRELFSEPIKTLSKISHNNGKTIFRVNDWIIIFPENERVQNYMARHQALTPYLKAKTTICFPNFSFQGSKYAVYGYRVIKGCELTKGLYSRCLNKTALHSEIADFIKVLHSFDVGITKEFGYSEYHLENLSCFESKDLDLDEKSKKLIAFCINMYQKLLKHNTTLVLCHTDLHGANIIVNEEGQNGLKLEGIIDFDEMSLAPIFVEFGKMHHLSSDFASGVIESYEKDPIKRDALFCASIIEYIARRVSYYLSACSLKDPSLQNYHREVLREFLHRPVVSRALEDFPQDCYLLNKEAFSSKKESNPFLYAFSSSKWAT